MNEWFDDLVAFLKGHPGRSVGAISGFILGVLLLSVGVKRTLFILLITALGFIIGNLIDANISIPGLDRFRKKKSRHTDADHYDDEIDI